MGKDIRHLRGCQHACEDVACASQWDVEDVASFTPSVNKSGMRVELLRERSGEQESLQSDAYIEDEGSRPE